MTPASDPYQTLGLNPGATPAEIKRAYRGLAKAYHPDSAGERTLPRFLAIQAAYERLMAGQPGGPLAGSRTQPARRPSSQGPTAAPPGRPWSADAERARATREGSRQRSTRPAAGSAGAGGAAGGPASGGGSSTGAAGAEGARGPATGRGSGRRGRPKASIGSTSYDGTENEPFEPGWAGATWYGAASGTYWTINPKEYADPRKHGPEYLARAQRPLAAHPGEEAAEGPAAAAGSDPSTQGGPAPAAAHPAPSAGSEPAAPPAPSAPYSGPTGRTRREPETATATAARAARPVAGFGWLDPARILRTWRGRLPLTALAWFPVGLAIFGIHGQLTGCAQFMASCTDPLAWSVWIPQAIVLAVLLASPRLAWIAATGSVVLIALTAPLAAILTAGSGGRPPSPATTELLLVTMAVGWTVGLGIALSGRIPLPPWRAARVR